MSRSLFWRGMVYLRHYGFLATVRHAWRWVRTLPHRPSERLERVAPSRQAAEYLVELETFCTPICDRRRLTFVTDSVAPGSLFGGVGTALMMSATLARALGAELRIVTEVQPAMPSVVALLFRVHGIDWNDEIDFVFSSREQIPRRSIDMRDDDVVVTAAWWTTWNALKAIHPSKIIYLIQEDERLFYPNGDLRLKAEELMRHRELRFAVNSHLLWQHLGHCQFENIRRNGIFFEPAFPQNMFHWNDHDRDVRQFVFYARPHHPRNLYQRGLEAINAALENGLLDPERWRLCFIGSKFEPPRLARDVKPVVFQDLPWDEYATVIRDADLGLCLMYTPLPGYPALDLAASGAAVVTTRYGCKQSLAAYSENIICVDPDLPSLLDGIEAGIALADDRDRRRRNYLAAPLLRDWRTAFAPVVRAFADPDRISHHPVLSSG